MHIWFIFSVRFSNLSNEFKREPPYKYEFFPHYLPFVMSENDLLPLSIKLLLFFCLFRHSEILIKNLIRIVGSDSLTLDFYFFGQSVIIMTDLLRFNLMKNLFLFRINMANFSVEVFQTGVDLLNSFNVNSDSLN